MMGEPPVSSSVSAAQSSLIDVKDEASMSRVGSATVNGSTCTVAPLTFGSE